MEDEAALKRMKTLASDSPLKSAKTAKAKTLADVDDSAGSPGPNNSMGAVGGTSMQMSQNNQEMRRIARLGRQAEWERFMATKPDDNDENPQDVAAIREAIRTMGDFKVGSLHRCLQHFFLYE